jgi:O-antigen/teichoic acid export membrane protein
MVLLMAAAAWLGQRFAPADYMWSVLAAVLLATTLTGAWLWRSELASLAPLHNMGNTRAQFAAALPFLGIALTSILQGEISTLLLGWFAGPREAGLFQPIVRMAPLIMLPVQAAGMRYAPRMAEFWRRGEIDRIRSVTTTFTLTTSLLTAGIALSLAASGPWIMWIFGPEFQQSAPLLWYIAAAQVFNAACGPVGMLLTMSGRSGGALNGHLAGLAVNVALGALLIPAHGAWGAIVGMVAGIVVWNLTMLGITRSHCGFDPSLAGVVVRSQRRN